MGQRQSAGMDEVVADTTYRNLEHLAGKYPEIFDELVCAVRDDQHTLSGEAAEMLRTFGLLEPTDAVRPSVRPIVLAAAQHERGAPVYFGYLLWGHPGPAPVPMTAQQKRELIGQCLKIADIFDTAFARVSSSRSWRVDGLNPFYDRTTSGLYLEFYSGRPDKLWTPWGGWRWEGWQRAQSAGGGTGVKQDRMVSAFMAHLDVELLIPLQQNRSGAFGPVYKLLGVDGEKLPAPGEIRPTATVKEYEAAEAEWAAHGGPHRAWAVRR